MGTSARRVSYERRIRLWLAGLAMPTLGLAGGLVREHGGSWPGTVAAVAGLGVCLGLASAYFYEQLVRPLQTLANVVAALREDDFSFRARGARRGDALGDLALEVNALAGTMQGQRLAAQDALTMVERVMTAMPSPVLAFDPEGRLRLVNLAAEESFGVERASALGGGAAARGRGELLGLEDEGMYSPAAGGSRWSVRRTTFRLHGVPHTLLVLTDVAAALREEERVAWQRLIRVLSHEVNNSLTPIKSIAGSLRTRLPAISASLETMSNQAEFQRGLTVIEERAASLNRFLQAYQELTRLPSPRMRRMGFDAMVGKAVELETRLRVRVEPGPSVALIGDPDQLEQLVINLIRNAVEAALSADAAGDETAAVTVWWTTAGTSVVLAVRDNGPGLTNPANLFVPFYTTKPSGSGIGLVLAQQIAAAHRGVVSLSNNRDGAGCTAELRLPL
jgi:nitrogen fixation/metabolism regulation signal transduction histidine kinase